MRLRSLAFLLLLSGGLVVLACGPTDDDPFARGGGGGGGDDDDDSTGDDPNVRWAYWDLVRVTAFDDTTATISTRASFFTDEPSPLFPLQPDGLDACEAGEAGPDPHDPPRSSDQSPVPSIFADGEDWPLERAGNDQWYSRAVPDRVWTEFASLTLSSGGTTWEEALPLPENLVGVSATLSEDGLELEWEGSVAENQLRLVVFATDPYRYVACLPADDGSFTVPAEDMLDTLEDLDVTVHLRRETRNDTLTLPGDRLGTTFGVSALEAQFSIEDGYWTGDDDDDDDAGDDDDSAR